MEVDPAICNLKLFYHSFKVAKLSLCQLAIWEFILNRAKRLAKINEISSYDFSQYLCVVQRKYPSR